MHFIGQGIRGSYAPTICNVLFVLNIRSFSVIIPQTPVRKWKILNTTIKTQLKKIISTSVVLWVKRFIYKEVLVIGDSHALVFTHRTFKSYFPQLFFNVINVPGATVSGMKNPNPNTQALSTFMITYKKSHASTVIVLLGEVDTGFVIWYRAEKYKMPVDDMLYIAIDNYKNLLIDLSKKYRVICISTPLPTIQDGQDCGAIANERKSVKATQLQRTKLTIQFNIQMREFCDINWFLYLSFDDESLDKNGLVSKSLLSSNPNDHHYDREKYACMIVDQLKTHLL
jgi:hypothetical protein